MKERMNERKEKYLSKYLLRKKPNVYKKKKLSIQNFMEVQNRPICLRDAKSSERGPDDLK